MLKWSSNTQEIDRQEDEEISGNIDSIKEGNFHHVCKSEKWEDEKLIKVTNTLKSTVYISYQKVSLILLLNKLWVIIIIYWKNKEEKIQSFRKLQETKKNKKCLL